MLSFINNFGDTGSADEMVKWSGGSKPHEQFFTDPTVRQFYKNHVNKVINRVNSINGRR